MYVFQQLVLAPIARAISLYLLVQDGLKLGDKVKKWLSLAFGVLKLALKSFQAGPKRCQIGHCKILGPFCAK